jgi:hypothetical protein
MNLPRTWFHLSLSSTVIGLGVAVFIPVSRHVDINKCGPNLTRRLSWPLHCECFYPLLLMLIVDTLQGEKLRKKDDKSTFVMALN